MSLTVRVVAPVGRDADLIVDVLRRHGIASEACPDALQLLEAAAHDYLGPLLIAEESLTPEVIENLIERVNSQPAWSDFPILILTTGGVGLRRGRNIEEQHLQLGSPILLERPLRTETLVSSLRAAVRARMRQYEVRDALQARDQALAELRVESETLRVSEERFRRLIEHASVGIYIMDVQGQIFYSNPALLSALGYTAADSEGGHIAWNELTPPEFVEADKTALAEVLQSGACHPYQKSLRSRDGSLVPFLVGMTILSPESVESNARQIAVFMTDMTSQKQAETALIQSEKLAAVGRLAASISHEINNPLEAITNLLYIVRQEPHLPPGAREHLSLAELELTRVSQIATQTLRFHRQSTGAREVTADELLQSVITLYHGRLINSNIEVQYKRRSAEPVMCFDGDIRQVLNNLVGNAIDSMRNGGKLLLRSCNCKSWRTGERGLIITVADTGEGMTPEVRGRIFDAFYSTKGTNGTGLGLWISKGIVDKHCGLLEVRSSRRPNCSGTVFRLFLPHGRPSTA